MFYYVFLYSSFDCRGDGLHNQKRPIKVEIQLRTLSMDWWASIEHKIRYKKNLLSEQINNLDKELLECAKTAQEQDDRMEKIHFNIVEV